MQRIASETNKYAWQIIASKTEREERISITLGKWKETTVDELMRFFAVLNYMSICYRARIDEYWMGGVLEMPEFRAIMGRDRFLHILRFLHFVDNEELSPVGQTRYQRKIEKIAPILDHCNAKFAEMYVPQRELSLDESLLLWKGRLSWVQCIRSKAARFGIKSFELCEAESGYLLRMLLYAGKDSSMCEGPVHGFNNPTAKVVVELMDGFLDVGHLLTMDNWYNQLVLTRFLKARKTDVVGTMCRRRQHVPEAIRSAVERHVERGDQIAMHCGDVSMVAWKDVKLVTLISTYHNADRVDGHRAGQAQTKPAVVETYNRHMGGVDLKDQKLSQYFFERKRGRKWYVKVFRRLMNVSILNTFTIASKIPGFAQETMRKFRYQLSEDLLKGFPAPRVARPPVAGPHARHEPIKDQHIREDRVRLDGALDHFPENAEKVGNNHSRRRCACCSRRGEQSRVITMCSKCQVALCLGQCWRSYHTLHVL
ncbi:transposase IS4 domain-containing protein [Phthorimaea operculella]|nr:transposase IS4 domain-containing protein [Phthorimaea operculella]